ncbi:MAG: HTTM domain-containing protein [Fimbriimonadaceae bacterium]|nr:HTTM domain-containing protein [Fimbriimonadaceae bacterium]
MLTGTLAFVNFAMIAIDFDSWFTERGFVPAWFAERWAGGIPRLNLLANVTDDRVTMLVYGLLMLACLLTAVGLFTRVSSIAMFALIVTMHHRNPEILHSGDTLLRNMAFYVMIAPSGAALSLDRVIGLWKGTAPSIPAEVSLWPQRLVHFQVAVLYFTTAWHKWGGSTWRDGTATWYVPQLHEFDRFPLPAFMDQQPIVAITTYGTLLVELAFASLVFAKPFRKWVLLSGLILHGFIEYRFNIPLFSFIMTSTYVAFYRGEEVSAWWNRLTERFQGRRLRLLAPHGADWSPNPLRALKALDAFRQIEFETGQEPALEARTAAGRPVSPVLASLARCPGAWALWLWVPAWRRVLNAALQSRAMSAEAAVQPIQEAATV